MQKVETGHDKILDEHRELHTLTSELKTFLVAPRPVIGTDEAHAWASDLAERLVRLHDRAYRHFRYEESCGVFEEIERERPSSAGAIEGLRRDHDRLLADFRAVLGATMVYSEAKTPENPGLRRWTLSILSHLERHEEEETDLLQKTLCRDLGQGD